MESHVWIEIFGDATQSLTTREITRVVGCSAATVRNWRAGKTLPNARAWRRMVVAAGKTDQWVVLSGARDAAAPQVVPAAPRR